jgi:hypothetical protein
MLIYPEISGPLDDITEPLMAVQHPSLQMKDGDHRISKPNFLIYNILKVVWLRMAHNLSVMDASGGNKSYQVRSDMDVPPPTNNRLIC